MPSTTNFNWTTPADTDLVKDGAAAIRTLGNGIDTSLVDLKGGTTGQVLSKNSNTDLDYTWVTPNVGDITEVQAGTGISIASGTGPIPVVTNTVATAFDAKGDLIAGTGADTFSKLTVGANNTVLTADSSTATGLKWAAASSPSFCGVAVYNGSLQSINNNTETTVDFDNEYFDTDGFHSIVTNTSRLTVPAGKGGYYLIRAQGLFAVNATGRRGMMFRKNGTTTIRYSADVIPSGTIAVGNVLTVTTNLVAGDYVELRVYQNSGGALNFDGRASGEQFVFEMSLLGA